MLPLSAKQGATSIRVDICFKRYPRQEKPTEVFKHRNGIQQGKTMPKDQQYVYTIGHVCKHGNMGKPRKVNADTQG